MCKSPVAVAWSSYGGVALRYVLLVLSMMSRLWARRHKGLAALSVGDQLRERLGRSLMSVNASLLVVFVASYCCPSRCQEAHLVCREYHYGSLSMLLWRPLLTCKIATKSTRVAVVSG